MLPSKIDFVSIIDSNLKLGFVALDSKRNFHTHIYDSTHYNVNLTNINHFTLTYFYSKSIFVTAEHIFNKH